LLPLFVSILIGLGTAASPPPVPSPPTFSLTLSWTAPGDDGKVGRAQTYSLRYSVAPITEASFAIAATVAGLPTPGPAGAIESVTVPGLEQNTVYYFALKTQDEAGNWSGISNVVRFPSPATTVEDVPAPEIRFSAPWPNPARTGIRCALALPERAEVEVDVFSVTGRHVRSLASGSRAAGRGELAWDLRDDSGGRVATGVYWVRARLAGRVFSHPVTVVR
jgi:hypothetical protein